jgi:hypothetical protein
MLDDAWTIAKDSGVALAFVGLNGSQVGEVHDRSTIQLPESATPCRGPERAEGVLEILFIGITGALRQAQ